MAEAMEIRGVGWHDPVARGDGHFIRGHWALAPECDIRLIVDDDLVIDIAVHRAPD